MTGKKHVDPATLDRLIRAALILHAALKAAREEMPPCYVAQEVNYAEHWLEDTVRSLRKAREWSEDEFMNGEKSVQELLLEVGITLGKSEAILGNHA